MCMCMCIYRVFPETQRPRGAKPQLNHDLIVHLRRMRKAKHDILKQFNQDLIVVDVGAPQGAQLNHDLIVYVRHMGKALHDAIEQLNQDLIFLDVGGCQGAGTGQLTQELIFFNSWINCLPPKEKQKRTALLTHKSG